ncbi:DUF1428 family protein [Halomonas sp. M20]|uniref:DUF1428 family protein n=1 Tax=Halomonas sp. M20 TaxID=2763264 RepID=UPI0039B6CD3A
MSKMSLAIRLPSTRLEPAPTWLHRGAILVPRPGTHRKKSGITTYIDGLVVGCPEDKRQAFIAHANKAGHVFLNLGAPRILGCWGDDVPDGKTIDFLWAVQMRQGGAGLFSWIE